jgi:hypothetical protein
VVSRNGSNRFSGDELRVATEKTRSATFLVVGRGTVNRPHQGIEGGRLTEGDIGELMREQFPAVYALVLAAAPASIAVSPRTSAVGYGVGQPFC